MGKKIVKIGNGSSNRMSGPVRNHTDMENDILKAVTAPVGRKDDAEQGKRPSVEEKVVADNKKRVP